eukprot:7295005-Prymnesium_polylepis.1
MQGGLGSTQRRRRVPRGSTQEVLGSCSLGQHRGHTEGGSGVHTGVTSGGDRLEASRLWPTCCWQGGSRRGAWRLRHSTTRPPPGLRLAQRPPSTMICMRQLPRAKARACGDVQEAERWRMERGALSAER